MPGEKQGRAPRQSRRRPGTRETQPCTPHSTPAPQPLALGGQPSALTQSISGSIQGLSPHPVPIPAPTSSSSSSSSFW
eukprot:616348-Rhodomonas_salina.1